VITVMLASRNGARHLKRVMDAFAALQAPEGGWKLIAVDNASTDGTGDVMRAYAGRLPLTVLTEPMPGKNRALNRALELAEGDFYIFADDDVVVGRDWLVAWREAADAHPDYDLFAGCTKPLWPSEPPQHLLTGVNVSVLFATHAGVNEGPCPAYQMYGTNMAIRARVFDDGVRFDDGIGPDGSTIYAMGSDTEMANRLEALGFKCWFAARPAVGHIIRPEQLDQNWILARGYRWGRGLARMHCPYPEGGETLAYKNSLKRILFPILLPLFPWENRWRRQWHAAVDRGYEDGSRENNGLKRRWA
jgi:glycosyltransferase involved in cell wall biosynthesis